jgi:hypothetical protein
MSEQNAAASMTAAVDMLRSPRVAQAATIAQTDSITRVEYWAKRVMWLLVAAMSLWDIAETFDKHFAVLSGVLPHS